MKQSNYSDLRVQRTLMNIRNAFFKCLQQTEFSKITVSQICDEALVRKATFYNHFTDKLSAFEYFTRFRLKEIFDEFIKQNHFDTYNDYDIGISVFCMNKMVAVARKYNNLLYDEESGQLVPIFIRCLADELSNRYSPEKKALLEQNNIDIKLNAYLHTGSMYAIIRYLEEYPDKSDTEIIEACTNFNTTFLLTQRN